MILMAVGLNQTTPLSIREKLVFTEEEAQETTLDLKKKGLAKEIILISTCNRTELYCDNAISQSLIQWLAKYKQLPLNDIQPYIYQHTEISAVKHLFRVASGLDSMVLGEVEILGQLKTAYRLALKSGTLGKSLDRLFQFAFSVAKQVRTKTGIGVNPVSVASIAVRLADRIFRNLQEATVLLIGAGQLIQLALEHLKSTGVRKILIANRNANRTLNIGNGVDIEMVGFESIPDRLPEADIVMSATASVLPILGKGMVERALKKRKHRPIYMVDLAVPRDIEPEVGQLADVYLYCLDDLKEMAAENLSLRHSAAVQAEHIIDQEAGQFMQWLRSRSTLATLNALRHKYEELRDDTLKKALQQLQLGKSPEIVVQHALYGLTKRILHDPSRRLRQPDECEEELLYHTRKLFDLNDEIIDTN